jgi:hypothetical protein
MRCGSTASSRHVPFTHASDDRGTTENGGAHEKVFIGVDPHKASVAVAAVNEVGGELVECATDFHELESDQARDHAQCARVVAYAEGAVVRRVSHQAFINAAGGPGETTLAHWPIRTVVWLNLPYHPPFGLYLGYASFTPPSTLRTLPVLLDERASEAKWSTASATFSGSTFTLRTLRSR